MSEVINLIVNAKPVSLGKYRVLATVKPRLLPAYYKTSEEVEGILEDYNLARNMLAVSDTGEPMYIVEEPVLDERLREEYELVFNKLTTATITAEEGGDVAGAYVSTLEQILSDFGVTGRDARVLGYYILRRVLGWDAINPLVNDPYIEDITLPKPTSNVYVIVKRPEKELAVYTEGWIKTNISFPSESEVADFLRFMATRSGGQITTAQPIAELRTPEGYRLAMNLAEIGDVSFTMRKFPSIVYSIADLIRFGTLSPEMATYFWVLIEDYYFILVIGEMASGKTTLLQALLSLVPSNRKIVTLEDTPELRLAHPLWEAHHTRRTATAEDIDLFKLGRYSLHTRAQYLVIGDVRGREIDALIQMRASGHGALSTFHAKSPDEVFMRITSPPLNVQPSFMVFINTIVLMQRLFHPEKGIIRRVRSVWEVTGLREEALKTGYRAVVYKKVFSYDPQQDTFTPNTLRGVFEKSKFLKDIAYSHYPSIKQFMRELEFRRAFMKKLVELPGDKYDYRKITELIAKAYRRILEMRMEARK